MSSIEVVKTDKGLRGFGEQDRKRYAKFKKFVDEMEPGEVIRFEWKQPRNVKFHRKLFSLLQFAFDHWDPPAKAHEHNGREILKSFDAFRKEVTILAGFYEMTFDLKGEMRLEAKSISFANMDEEEFSRLYEAVVSVILNHVLTNYTRDDIDRVVAELERYGWRNGKVGA